MRLITLTTAVLLALALLPAAAGASVRQYALFQDDGLLVENGDAARTNTLDEVRSLGADMIKAQLNWSVVAPGGKRKPSGFDGADPSGYDWARFDALVADARARGFKVMLALAPPAPGWATPTRGDRAGVKRPNAREFGRFAEAAAKHFRGVSVWTIWNEPNHPGHLYPQSVHGKPVAPGLYRALVRSAVAGLKRGGAAAKTTLFGELLPIGKSSTGPKRNLKPLTFLRSFFRGASLSGLDGFAYHPYTRPQGPLVHEPSADDATVHSFGRVLRALDSARAQGHIKGPKLPIWNTEFGFQTDPARREHLAVHDDRPGRRPEPVAERPPVRQRDPEGEHLRQLPPTDPRAPARPGRGRGARGRATGRRGHYRADLPAQPQGLVQAARRAHGGP
jgi:hypothetical protein